MSHSFQAWLRLHDQAEHAVFTKGIDGRYWYMNDVGARLLGRRPAEVIGRDDFELFREDSAQTMRARDLSILDSGTGRTYESVATANGRTRVYLSTKEIWRDPDGACLGLIGISRDVTAESERIRRLQTVVSVASHELRGPLAALQPGLPTRRRFGAVAHPPTSMPDAGEGDALRSVELGRIPQGLDI